MHSPKFLSTIFLLATRIQAATTTTLSSPPTATSNMTSITPYSLPLGAQCIDSAQCAGGAQCYAVNSMEIERCGNFQAVCEDSSQCAFNTCVNGFCSGPVGVEVASSGSTITGSAASSTYDSGAASSTTSADDLDTLTSSVVGPATFMWTPPSTPAFPNATIMSTSSRVPVVTVTSTTMVTGSANPTSGETGGASATKTATLASGAAGRMDLGVGCMLSLLGAILVWLGML